MKKFELPKMDIEMIDVADIITTSTEPACPENTALPCLAD